jgi:(p)ppGpp synthase/HD superfamily hydrolase
MRYPLFVPQRLANPVTAQFHEALSYASDLHATQARKDTEIPYVSHLLAVASIVMEAGGTEEEAIAALLHDGPEDQGGEPTLEAIRTRFGDVIAGIVAECSDTFETPKPKWAKRKRDYIESLATASPGALLVSAADKLHNARATLRDLREHGAIVWTRFNPTREETLGNYRNLIAAYETATPDPRRAPIERELRETIELVEQR